MEGENAGIPSAANAKHGKPRHARRAIRRTVTALWPQRARDKAPDVAAGSFTSGPVLASRAAFSARRMLAAERIERLTAQQAEHDLGFAFRTPAQRERGQAGAPGGSGLASWAARFDSSGSVIGFIGFRFYCPVSKEIGGDIIASCSKPEDFEKNSTLFLVTVPGSAA
jgi:hypothetical protein